MIGSIRSVVASFLALIGTISYGGPGELILLLLLPYGLGFRI